MVTTRRRAAAERTASSTSADTPPTFRRTRSSMAKKNQGSTKVDSSKLNPVTKHYEFGGPIGAIGMIIGLPALVLFFATFCDATGYPSQNFWNISVDNLRVWLSWENVKNSINPWAFAWYFGFLINLAVMSVSLPGNMVDGTKLRDGRVLKYKINALGCLQALITMNAMMFRGAGINALGWVYDNYVSFCLASILTSFLVAGYVYYSSFKPGKMLALGGNTGTAVYDFMIGRELNPRIRDFDIKFFVELRPNLIGWLLMDICMAAKQYTNIGRLTNSMVLVVLAQVLYIVDALYNESAILTTMDITTDGFGFMLAFGNLCWVPMVYCMQARYLVDFPVDLNYLQVAVIVGLLAGGYYIFRAANGEKDKFRTDPHAPEVKHLKYIQTSTGSRLITSSWWGRARHINYLGDLMMGLAYCLPCGFGSPIPYFYAIYFTVLLVHRERRDDEKCHKKYGKDWEKYCEIVKSRILPGVY
ncbi:unnamed protein product [Umbelopsis ramanniana]